MGAVRQRLPADTEHGRTLPVVGRQRSGPSQPPARRYPATRLYRHEPELAADLALDLAVAAGLGERERLVQKRRALFVTAANGVHQRSPKRRQRTRQQRRVADAPRLRTRLPQARHAGLHRAGIHGRAPRVKLPHGGRPIAARRGPLRVTLVGGPAHPRIGRTPQLAAEQRLARVGMIARGANLARARKAPHKQLVGAIIEPVQRNRPRRQRGCVKRNTASERTQRGIPQHGLTHARRAPALHQQPRIELRPGAGIDPLQQLATNERGIRIARQRAPARPRQSPPAAPAPTDPRAARRLPQARDAAAPTSTAAPRADHRHHRRPATPAACAPPVAPPGPRTPAQPTPYGHAAARPPRRRARSPTIPADGSRASTRHHDRKPPPYAAQDNA